MLVIIIRLRNLDFIGLENGIKETYNKLKNEY
jgi:hypothetical protein